MEFKSPEGLAKHNAALGCVAVVGVAVVIALIYGPGAPGYDGIFAVYWGRELLGFSLPDYQAALAPTPHPLANLAGAVAAVFGSAGPAVFQWMIVLSAGGLALGAYSLGRKVGGIFVGLLFAVVLLTRADIALEIEIGLIDIPFLAFVIGAVALALKPGVRSTWSLVLLLLAGLLRPEAWLLAIAYAVFLLVTDRPEGRRRIWIVVLALAGPAVWALVDLVTTGSPFHSLSGTQDLAAQLERPRSLRLAFELLPQYLRSLVSTPVAWIGLVGAMVALFRVRAKAAIPLFVMFAGMAGFLALGVFDLPVLRRYLLLPAALLCLFAAYGLLGWIQEKDRLVRTIWIPIAVAAAVWLVISVPNQVDVVEGQVSGVHSQGFVQDKLVDLANSPNVQRLRGCGNIYVPSYRARPYVAYALDLPLAKVRSAGDTAIRQGIMFADPIDSNSGKFSLDRFEPQGRTIEVPKTFKQIAGNQVWAAYSDCK